MSKFSMYLNSPVPVEVVDEVVDNDKQISHRELYDVWAKFEDMFFDLGQEMFKSGIPIGFINSSHFNPKFKASLKADNEGVKKYRSVMQKIGKLAKRDIPFEIPQSVEHVNLSVSLWLLSHTYCYVSSAPLSENEDKFVSGKVSTQVGTLNDVLLGELGIDLPKRVVVGVNKMIDGLVDDVQAGYLPMPVVEFNKQSIKIPRKKVNFQEDEYMVVPVSLVMGWVKACRETMRDNIVVINARKTEGALREFTLTSNGKAVGDVYDRDQELIEMFEFARSLPSQYPYFKSRVYNWEGLHNLNLLYFELGISKDDYPKRMMNLNRVESIQIVPIDDTEAYKSKLRQVKRYANVDVDVVISQVQVATQSWTLEQREDFLNETLNKLKSSVGAVPDSDVKLKGTLDFTMKFTQAIDYYSTAYVRAVVDYMLEHPVEFDNFTGNDVNVVSVVESVVAGVSDTPVALDDDDLEF